MLSNKLFISISLIAIITTGCITLKSKKAEAPPIPADGGFYSLNKNRDGDYVWSQNVYLATTSAQKPDFKTADVLAMAKDPRDNQAIYLGAKEHGLYYTYDAGKNWFQPEKFKQSKINAIGVSYKNKCLIYVATGAELYKSEDCSRTWTRMYSDTRADEGYYISALAVDSYSEGIVYIGVSVNKTKKEKGEGEVNKSIDFGRSWQPDKQLRVARGSIVSKIVVNPNDTRIVYAATNNAGVFKTANGGEDWKNITGEAQEIPTKKEEQEGFARRFEKLIDFTTDIKTKKTRDSLVFRDMIIIPDKNDSLIHASNYGLLKSNDGGQTWSEIELIPPEGEEKAIIYSLDINPEDGKEFYYGTDDTLFKTVDDGKSWTTIKGPGTRAIYQIITTPNDSGESNVYVGVYNLNPPVPKK